MKYIENQLKAKIVKLQDKNNNFTSDNVEDALNRQYTLGYIAGMKEACN